MLLYHFTHAPGLAGIRKDGFIRPSAADHSFAGGYVCLTSDPDRMGHGLPDGRPIPQGHSTPLKAFNVNGVICCADHTEFRLTIPIDEADKNKIWEVFNRSVGDEVIESSGMGLAVCKKILDAHKFKCGFNNLATGVEFYFKTK